MDTFKDFVSKAVSTIGLVEPIIIRGLGTFQCKVDTGNGGYNVIHGSDITVDGKRKVVTFKTVDGDTVTHPLIDRVTIHVGAGEHEDRPVIELDVEFKGQVYDNERFSVGDRSQNELSILLSKDFIAKTGALVDVTR